MMSQSKYINPFTDFGFKKIFGEDAGKASLVSFLNDVLPIDRKIAEVSFLPSDQLGNLAEDRAAIYDIFCKDESGGQFIVEMQNARQTYFKDRTVFYSTFPIQRQAEKGDWQFKLDNVYCVSFLGFEMPGEEPGYLHHVQLKNQTNKVFYDKLSYIYIELPKFVTPMDKLENHLEKWLYFLKHLEEFDSLPVIFKEEVFVKTLERIEYISLKRDEQLTYERSLKSYRDRINEIITAKNEGREEGREEGRQQGRQEELREDIKDVLDERFGECSYAIIEGLSMLDDIPQLRSLHRLAVRIESLAAFQQHLTK